MVKIRIHRIRGLAGLVGMPGIFGEIPFISAHFGSFE